MAHRTVVVLAALVATLLLACGGPSKQVAAQGEACEASTDCARGLACKGARCQPPRSEVGGVCVTDKGCSPDLTCVSGRCATGLAGADPCAAACVHLRDLMAAEMRAGGEDVDAPVARATLLTFEQDCVSGCVSHLSVEHARCIESAADLDAVKACP